MTKTYLHLCVSSNTLAYLCTFLGDPMGKVSSRHAIIMDEVDGMAGNEDRGGMRVK